MKILNEETVYSSRYFNIQKKVIERNGKTFTKEFIERKSTVYVIPFTKGEVYLEKQFRDSFNKDLIEVVAGHIEDDASPLETAKKELAEETGIKAQSWKQIAEWEIAANMIQKVYVFAATDLSFGETNLEIDEQIETVKYPLEKIITMIENGEIVVAPQIAALLLFDKLRKEEKL